MTVSKALHLLSDNRHLAPEEFQAIRRGLDDIERLHRGFRSYLEAHGLDAEVFLPGNIWGELYDFESFENWTYDLVNMVRSLAPLFTGFDMLGWERRDGSNVNVPALERFHADVMRRGVVAADFEQQLQRRFGLVTKLWLSRYLIDARARLLENVPARYVARWPDRMGEIGVVHDDAIINPDLLTYQSRINAMIGGGVLRVLEDAIERHGSASLLEIGPGLGFLPYALQQAFEGRLRVFLIDLPRMMAFGYAYLAGVVGARNVGVVTASGQTIPDTPFVFVPSYLVPAVDAQLPKFDVVCNAISLNEMNRRQIEFYLDLIDAHLAPTGVFFLEQGEKYLDYHEDAMRAAQRRFPNHRCSPDPVVNGLNVMAYPNSYFYANARG